jgi:hypothetical protein
MMPIPNSRTTIKAPLELFALAVEAIGEAPTASICVAITEGITVRIGEVCKTCAKASSCCVSIPANFHIGIISSLLLEHVFAFLLLNKE